MSGSYAILGGSWLATVGKQDAELDPAGVLSWEELYIRGELIEARTRRGGYRLPRVETGKAVVISCM